MPEPKFRVRVWRANIERSKYDEATSGHGGLLVELLARRRLRRPLESEELHEALFQTTTAKWQVRRAETEHATAPIESRFNRLVREWRTAKRRITWPHQAAMLPAYQRIIGMGPAVLPLILRELARDNDEWYWALRVISDADPVPFEDRGRRELMREHWLAWGRRQGLIGAE